MPIAEKGPLTEHALAGIFDHIRNRSGKVVWGLRVWDARNEKRFAFARQWIRLHHSWGRQLDRLGQILVRHGKLLPTVRDDLVEVAKSRKKPMGEIAIELGLLNSEDIETALRLQMEVHLSDLYFWKDAQFELLVEETPEALHENAWEFVVFVEIGDILEDVARRRRKWQALHSFIQSDQEVFRRTGLEPDLADQSNEALPRVLTLIDGKKRVHEIVIETELAEFQVYEALQTLLVEGVIERGEGAFVSAQSRREEITEEVRRLEAERTHRGDSAKILVQLADRYMAIGERTKAAQRWRNLARMQIKNGEEEKALESLKRASQCNPRDYDIQEEILDVYAAMGREQALIEEGLELGDLYFRRNLLDRARRLFGHLVYLAPREPRVRRLYGLTLLGLGQKKLALWQFRELAQLLEALGCSDRELSEVYRQILALDPEDAKAHNRVKMFDVTPTARPLTRVAAVVVGLAFAGLLVAHFGQRLKAADINEEIAAVESLLNRNEFTDLTGRMEALGEEPGDSDRLSLLRTRVIGLRQEYLAFGLAEDRVLAERLTSRGSIEAARRVYRQMIELAPPSHETVLAAKEMLDELEGAEVRSRVLVALGLNEMKRGQTRTAHQTLASAYQLFPHTEALGEAKFPVKIETVPSGAEILLDGVPVGTAPLEMNYSVRPASRIRVRMPGFDDLELVTASPLRFRETLRLNRIPAWRLKTPAAIDQTPAVLGGIVYAAGRDRMLHAVDLNDGSARGRVRLGLGGDATTAVVAEGNSVAVGTATGDVILFEAVSLRERWRRRIESRPHQLILDVEGDRLFVLSETGRVSARSLETGGPLWHAEIEVGTDTPLRRIDGGLLLAIGADGRQRHAINESDGRVAWSREKVPGAKAQAPLHLENPISLRALKTESHAGWHVEFAGAKVVGFVPYEEAVYVVTADGLVHCLGREKGRTLWISELGETPATGPVVEGGRVLVPTLEGSIIALPAGIIAPPK